MPRPQRPQGVARTTATLAGRPPSPQTTRVSQVVTLRGGGEDALWAVVASLGPTSRVAEIFPSRSAALADRAWREQQVRAYAGFLSASRNPVPRYSVTPIRRSDLPRAWRPLPALGFLRGSFL